MVADVGDGQADGEGAVSCYGGVECQRIVCCIAGGYPNARLLCGA